MKPYDVVVVGGGPGGITAALAAARLGAKTILVEKYGFLGGMSTAALVYPWMTHHDRHGNQVIRGIAQEIVDRLVEMNASPGHLRDTIGFTSYLTPYDQEAYKFLTLQMMGEAGVDLLLHALVVGCKTSGKAIASITIQSEYGGEREISGRYFVDGTGSAGLVDLAGGRTYLGREEDQATQPMSQTFRLGRVDLQPVKAYMRAHPEEFFETSLIEELDHLPLSGVSGFYSIWAQHGPPDIPRNLVLFFPGVHFGEVFINTGRVVLKNPSNLQDVTDAEKIARKQTQDLVHFLRQYIPGFADAYLIQTGPQIGIREIRRIAGHYLLSVEDIARGRRFPSVISRCGYPIDIHDPTGKGIISSESTQEPYDIPYESIVPLDFENVLLAGRAISCDVQTFASLRTTPTCMAIGQAAGVAAALGVQHDLAAINLPISEIQHLLLQGDAELGLGG
jgi:FAD dependent oxidoreductase